MNKRFRASYKIAIGFVALALLGVYGYRYANYMLLGREHFPPLVPGEVNILGLDTKAGYGVLVQNRAAKLVLAGENQFGPGNMDERSLENSDAERRFVPIKEMLKAMAGDEAALAYFIQRLKNIEDSMLPPDAPVWRVEDIAKAVKGDAQVREKLVSDLNVTLDGQPLDRVRKSALYNGIIVDVPVPIKVRMGNVDRTLIARVKRPYRARLLTDVENRLAGKFANDETVATQYAAAANDIRSNNIAPEEVGQTLLRFANDAPRLAEFPQSVLSSVTTVLNERQITSARYVTVHGSRSDTYTLLVDVTDEGRKRLWQYTGDRVGDQLLVTVNGVAVAAPFIQHAISGGEIEIAGIQDESLAQLAVDTINQRATTK